MNLDYAPNVERIHLVLEQLILALLEHANVVVLQHVLLHQTIVTNKTLTANIGASGVCKCGSASVCATNSDICKFWSNSIYLGDGGVCKCGTSALCSIATDTCIKINSLIFY